MTFSFKNQDRIWGGVAFDTDVAAANLLTRAAACFECFNRSRYEESDHVIFVGEVERCSHREGASALLYHGGRFYTEHPLQALFCYIFYSCLRPYLLGFEHFS